MFEQFIVVVDGIKLTVLGGLIITNLITGLAVAIKTGNFKLKEVGDFLRTKVLPYVIAYLGVGLIAMIDTSWTWAITAAWAIILATLVGAIFQNLKELGINIPEGLGGSD